MSAYADLAERILSWLPATTRERLKRRFGALGHAPGLAQTWRARRLAADDKRLDRVAPGLAWWIGHAIGSVEGRDCLEFGSGHVLTEAIVCRLAGARQVTACDYYPLLDRAAAVRALDRVDRSAIADALIVRAAAPDPLGQLDAIMAALAGGADILAAARIEYAAPVDLSNTGIFQHKFDFIHSTSVLEHVPAALAAPILSNLYAALKPGGAMVHQIHLEDHRDFARAPFAFLAHGTDWRPEDADTRGNRLRASQWIALAQALPGSIVSTPYVRLRDDLAPPRMLDGDFAGCTDADIRTANIGLVVRKREL